jgi:hypothetical protein
LCAVPDKEDKKIIIRPFTVWIEILFFSLSFSSPRMVQYNK